MRRISAVAPRTKGAKHVPAQVVPPTILEPPSPRLLDARLLEPILRRGLAGATVELECCGWALGGAQDGASGLDIDVEEGEAVDAPSMLPIIVLLPPGVLPSATLAHSVLPEGAGGSTASVRASLQRLGTLRLDPGQLSLLWAVHRVLAHHMLDPASYASAEPWTADVSHSAGDLAEFNATLGTVSRQSIARTVSLRAIERAIVHNDGTLSLAWRRHRRGPLRKLCAMAAQHTGFLVAPARTGAIDWAAASEIQHLSRHGGLLELLRRGLPCNGLTVCTPHNRQFYRLEGVEEHLSPSSTFERTVERGKREPGELQQGPFSQAEPSEAITYAEYYKTRWGIEWLDPAQPLVRAWHLRSCRERTVAGGAKAKRTGEGVSPVFLVPELCRVSPVSDAVAQALAPVPRLLYDLETALLAAGALKKIPVFPGDAPPLAALQRALTLRSAAPGAAECERLETLGDAFIKLTVSAELFRAHRGFHEGQLSAQKDSTVSNLALAEIALGLGLQRHLRVWPFSLANWILPSPVKVGRSVWRAWDSGDSTIVNNSLHARTAERQGLGRRAGGCGRRLSGGAWT